MPAEKIKCVPMVPPVGSGASLTNTECQQIRASVATSLLHVLPEGRSMSKNEGMQHRVALMG